MSDAKRPCPRCLGSGWVCERHPTRRWAGASACPCAAPGMPCACNPSAQLIPGTQILISANTGGD